MASSDSIWNDCLTRNTQRLLYEARSVIFFTQSQNFLSIFFNCQLEKWLTLHLHGQYFTHGCVLAAHPPPLLTNIQRVNSDSSQCVTTPRQHCNTGIIREDCQKVKELRWVGGWWRRARGQPGPITGSSKHMHTRLTACNKLKMTLYVFCSPHQAHPSIKIPSQGEQRWGLSPSLPPSLALRRLPPSLPYASPPTAHPHPTSTPSLFFSLLFAYKHTQTKPVFSVS